MSDFEELARRAGRSVRAEAAAADAQLAMPAGSSRAKFALGGVALAAAAIIAIVFAFAGGSSHHKLTIASNTSTTTTRVRPTTTSTSTTTSTLPAAIRGGAGIAFQPVSVTFISPDVGFALGRGCSRACSGDVVLMRTEDGGHSWTRIDGLPTNVAPSRDDADGLSVRFADTQNGYVVGLKLWVTHDGARTWKQASVDGTVDALEIGNGIAHAAVFDATKGAYFMESTPVRGDSWTKSMDSVPVGGGPIPRAQIVLQGAQGWMVENDRTVVGGLRLENGVWKTWTPPCLASTGSTALAAATDSYVATLCSYVYTGPVRFKMFVSIDSGASFAGPIAIPRNRSFNAIASPTPGTILLADGMNIILTRDTGRTWTTVWSGSSIAVSDFGFTTPTQGVAIVSRELLMTRDGGAHWSQVVFPLL